MMTLLNKRNSFCRDAGEEAGAKLTACREDLTKKSRPDGLLSERPGVGVLELNAFAVSGILITIMTYPLISFLKEN